jgi:hypothetical protein
VRVRARRLEAEPLHERAVQVRPLQELEVRVDAGGLLGHGEQRHRERDRPAALATPASALAATARHPQPSASPNAERRERVPRRDRQRGLVQLRAPAERADAHRGGRAADEKDEQRVRSAERPLGGHEHREHERRDQRHARVEQDAQDHRRERHGHVLRAVRRDARC